MAHEHVVEDAVLGEHTSEYWHYLNDGAVNSEKVLSPEAWLDWKYNGNGKAEQHNTTKEQQT